MKMCEVSKVAVKLKERRAMTTGEIISFLEQFDENTIVELHHYDSYGWGYEGDVQQCFQAKGGNPAITVSYDCKVMHMDNGRRF
jgi:hypothetical protein